MGEAEARATVRMVQGMGLDPVAVREGQRVAGRETVVGEAGGELVQVHREKGWGEDPVENGLGRLGVPAAAVDVDRAVAQDRRLEEGQAADVIAMTVSPAPLTSYNSRATAGTCSRSLVGRASCPPRYG